MGQSHKSRMKGLAELPINYHTKETVLARNHLSREVFDL